MDERINIINENLKLTEYSDGLLFGTDAYLLSAFVPKKIKSTGVDLGSGSGVIPLLILSKNKCKKVFGVEVQEKYAKLSEKNAKLNHFDDRFVSINKNVVDLTQNDIGEKVDFVVTNPPYMKANSGKSNISDEKNIARHEVLGNIDDFCRAASRILKFGGNMYVIYRPDRLCDLMYSLKNNNLEPKEMLFISQNTKSSPSLVIVNAKKGANSGLEILPPVYIYKNNSTEYTKQYANIYKNCKIGE